MGRFAGGQVCGLEGPRGVPGRAQAAGSSARAGARQAGAASPRRLTRALLARQSICYHIAFFVCVIAGGFGGHFGANYTSFVNVWLSLYFLGCFLGTYIVGPLWGSRLLVSAFGADACWQFGHHLEGGGCCTACGRCAGGAPFGAPLVCP